MNVKEERNFFPSEFELEPKNVSYVDDNCDYSKNVFEDPFKYIEEIKNIRINKKDDFTGKTLLCAWLTKLCPAKCEQCFFRSDMNHNCEYEEEYQLSNYGVDRLIKFINDSNNSYIMLSGGGDPMVHRDGVNSVIRNAKSDRIVIVTSGFWATTLESAEERINEIYKNFKERDIPTTVIFRISVDNFHCKQLGYDILPNILRVFNEKYASEENFKLQVHTIINDDTVKNIIAKMPKYIYEENNIECASDNKEVAKIVPQQAKIYMPNGKEILVGKAKMFYASLKADLTKYDDNVRKALEVFERDMNDSEYGNPAVVTNYDGTKGLDFWIDYNGNTTTWGNQQLDDLYNIYTDDFKDIYNGIMNNIISYSFLDKGYYYRENIVKEINPRTVLKSKAINLRDFASALLLEEHDTKLYYAIRVLQDYLKSGALEVKDLSPLSIELVKTIFMSTSDLKKQYKNSNYDIITQYFSENDNLSKNELEDLFFLIKLGHFDVSSDHLDMALNYYNKKFKTNYENINEIIYQSDETQYSRLHDRIAYMKKEALEKINVGKINNVKVMKNSHKKNK